MQNIKSWDMTELALLPLLLLFRQTKLLILFKRSEWFKSKNEDLRHTVSALVQRNHSVIAKKKTI